MTSLIPTADDAIRAALVSDWKKAIRLNSAILAVKKTDVDALLRLGFAYLKTGQFAAAKRVFTNVLSVDQYNQIATKNLKKLAGIKKKDIEEKSGATMSPMMFLEEPGKTKIVKCVHVAPVHVLSTLSAGQELTLKVKKHGVDVRLSGGTYVAALPDDVAFKLIKMIAGGNTYQAILKGMDKKSIDVLIRETARGKRFAKQPSFTSTSSYVSFAKTGSRDALDMTPTGEDDSDAAENPGEI